MTAQHRGPYRTAHRGPNPKNANRGRAFNSDEDVTIERMHNAGKGWSEIAAACPGRSPEACASRWRLKLSGEPVLRNREDRPPKILAPWPQWATFGPMTSDDPTSSGRSAGVSLPTAGAVSAAPALLGDA